MVFLESFYLVIYNFCSSYKSTGEIIPDEPIFDYLDSIKLGSSLGIVGLIAYIVLIYFGVIIQPENKLIETIIDMIKGCGYNC